MNKLVAIGVRLGGFVKRPRAYAAIALPVALPLLLTVLKTPTVAPPVSAAASVMPSARVRYDDLAVPSPAALPQHSVVLTIEDGDTLDSVLTSGGLDRPESAALNREFGKIVDLRRLRPGNFVRFHYGAGEKPDSIEMKIVGWGEVDAVRNGGGFDVSTHQAELRETDTTVSANIDSSLYDAVRGAG